MTDTVSLPLSSPVEAHGEPLATLALRPPKGRDIRLAGMPFSFDKDGQARIDAPAMTRMISALAGVPPSVIDGLSAEDWQAATAVVLDFFGTRTAAS